MNWYAGSSRCAADRADDRLVGNAVIRSVSVLCYTGSRVVASTWFGRCTVEGKDHVECEADELGADAPEVDGDTSESSYVGGPARTPHSVAPSTRESDVNEPAMSRIDCLSTVEPLARVADPLNSFDSVAVIVENLGRRSRARRAGVVRGSARCARPSGELSDDMLSPSAQRQRALHRIATDVERDKDGSGSLEGVGSSAGLSPG